MEVDSITFELPKWKEHHRHGAALGTALYQLGLRPVSVDFVEHDYPVLTTMASIYFDDTTLAHVEVPNIDIYSPDHVFRWVKEATSAVVCSRLDMREIDRIARSI